MVPAKLRKVLDEEQTVVVEGQPVPAQKTESGEPLTKVYLTFFEEDKCLFMYSPQGWREASKGFSTDPYASREERDRARDFFGLADETFLDGTGRCLIQKELRAKAEIDREVVTIGAGHRIEIWSSEQRAKEDERKKREIERKKREIERKKKGTPEGESTDAPAQDG